MGFMMKDQYQRNIDYLRISVTDRCNFRCRYCMPEEGIEPVCRREILTYEEILRLCRIAVKTGIRKIKITGGEPLVRRDVCALIRGIRDIPGVDSVTITTNGFLLADVLPELLEAGISGINISLDTLDRAKFSRITGRDAFHRVWDGFRRAVEARIPVKINCVPMRGVNGEELAELAALAKDVPVAVRFIEMMPVGMGAGHAGIPQDEVRRLLEAKYGAMVPVNEALGNGPARYYKLSGFVGRVGFISAMSHAFCGECNRIRLTADGILKPCLNFAGDIDLKKGMREGMQDHELEQMFREGIAKSPDATRSEKRLRPICWRRARWRE